MEVYMLEYTRASLDKIVSDIQKFFRYFTLGTQILYIVYLIYAIFAPAGILAVNIVLLAISVSYLAFCIYNKGEDKAFEKIVKRAQSWVKLSIRAITLGIAIYGIYAATTHVSVFSVVLTGLMIVMWILQILIEAVVYFVESRIELIVAGFEADIDNLKKPIQTVGNFIKKATGHEIEAPKEPSRQRKLLDKLVTRKREEKRLAKEEEHRRKADKIDAFFSKFKPKRAEKPEAGAARATTPELPTASVEKREEEYSEK